MSAIPPVKTSFTEARMCHMYESTFDITKKLAAISIKLPLILAKFCQITKPISLKK